MRQQLGNGKLLAGTLNNIGITFFSPGNLERAEEYLLKSGELCREIDDSFRLAGIELNLAMVHLDSRNLGQALARITSLSVRSVCC